MALTRLLVLSLACWLPLLSTIKGAPVGSYSCDFRNITNEEQNEGRLCSWLREQCKDGTKPVGLRFARTHNFKRGNRPRGAHISDATGPGRGHTSSDSYSTGGYAYLDTSGRQQGEKACLTSKSDIRQRHCVKFWYAKHGQKNHLGDLVVYWTQDGTEKEKKLEEEYEEWRDGHDDEWTMVEVSADADTTVTVELGVGTGVHGDIAIDDMSITMGTCDSDSDDSGSINRASTAGNDEDNLAVPDSGLEPKPHAGDDDDNNNNDAGPGQGNTVDGGNDDDNIRGGGDTGSCPPITPGTFGVCGGEFCQTDQDCTSKGYDMCCPSACGGNLCINNQPPRPPPRDGDSDSPGMPPPKDGYMPSPGGDRPPPPPPRDQNPPREPGHPTDPEIPPPPRGANDEDRPRESDQPPRPNMPDEPRLPFRRDFRNPDFLVRLNGGVSYGRVEICTEYQDGKCTGEWGTVCHDGWTEAETKAVCRDLGYWDGKRIDLEKMQVSTPSANIYLDGVRCSGNEKKLSECCHNEMKVHDCGNRPDNVEVAIMCFKDEVCALPSVTGRCRAAFQKFFFNSDTQRCELFTYGGCGGNENNFNTEDDCTAKCEGKPVPSLCGNPPETGPCFAHFPSYHYNSQTGNCENFVYGGCSGNPNRFFTHNSCMDMCNGYPGRQMRNDGREQDDTDNRVLIGDQDQDRNQDVDRNRDQGRDQNRDQDRDNNRGQDRDQGRSQGGEQDSEEDTDPMVDSDAQMNCDVPCQDNAPRGNPWAACEIDTQDDPCDANLLYNQNHNARLRASSDLIETNRPLIRMQSGQNMAMVNVSFDMVEKGCLSFWFWNGMRNPNFKVIHTSNGQECEHVLEIPFSSPWYTLSLDKSSSVTFIAETTERGVILLDNIRITDQYCRCN